jgi:hypothetical protein
MKPAAGVRLRNRLLLGFVVCGDVVVFGGGFALERYALTVAADPTSSLFLIIALLFANLFLLAVTLATMSATAILFARAVIWLRRRARVEVGEVPYVTHQRTTNVSSSRTK